jgi:hypothetical protein
LRPFEVWNGSDDALGIAQKKPPFEKSGE